MILLSLSKPMDGLVMESSICSPSSITINTLWPPGTHGVWTIDALPPGAMPVSGIQTHSIARHRFFGRWNLGLRAGQRNQCR